MEEALIQAIQAAWFLAAELLMAGAARVEITWHQLECSLPSDGESPAAAVKASWGLTNAVALLRPVSAALGVVPVEAVAVQIVRRPTVADFEISVANATEPAGRIAVTVDLLAGRAGLASCSAVGSNPY